MHAGFWIGATNDGQAISRRDSPLTCDCRFWRVESTIKRKAIRVDNRARMWFLNSMDSSGYSGTPLWKKLGYKTGMVAYVDDVPKNYIPLLSLPAEVEVRWLKRPASGMNFVHLFATDAYGLMTRLNACREKIAPDAVVWISWPKKTSGVASDLTENLIRGMVLPTGLVDIKVCAVDEVWSGLKFMIRKKLR
jgi:hypothetical protein